MFVTVLCVAFAYIAASLALCLYVDLNARARSRAGTLPPRMPMLVLRWYSRHALGYVFSSAFPKAQDKKTRWTVIPVRVCFALNYVVGPLLFVALFFWPVRS